VRFTLHIEQTALTLINAKFSFPLIHHMSETLAQTTSNSTNSDNDDDDDDDD
jgi:hypothetical protein